jgi:hypothetical protein
MIDRIPKQKIPMIVNAANASTNVHIQSNARTTIALNRWMGGAELEAVTIGDD